MTPRIVPFGAIPLAVLAALLTAPSVRADDDDKPRGKGRPESKGKGDKGRDDKGRDDKGRDDKGRDDKGRDRPNPPPGGPGVRFAPPAGPVETFEDFARRESEYHERAARSVAARLRDLESRAAGVLSEWERGNSRNCGPPIGWPARRSRNSAGSGTSAAAARPPARPRAPRR